MLRLFSSFSIHTACSMKFHYGFGSVHFPKTDDGLFTVCVSRFQRDQCAVGKPFQLRIDGTVIEPKGAKQVSGGGIPDPDNSSSRSKLISNAFPTPGSSE